ncbi:MAG: adenosine deaminase [Chloroflexota bacterium]
MSPSKKAPRSVFHQLPKVELHRHLEGAVRINTLFEIARQSGMDLPIYDPRRFEKFVQVDGGDVYNSTNFLAKFQTIRRFFLTPDIIKRVTCEAVADAAEENIIYLELRFTPVALSVEKKFSLAEVMDWVIEGVQMASEDYGVIVRLIASVNRHEPVELAAQVAGLAVERRDRGLVGLDLAGNEVDFPAQPFVNIFREANESGLQLTVHAGEWGEAASVRHAIEKFPVSRIGHGVRVIDDARVVALAREHETTFEVCITSNFQTGVVSALTNHPLPDMLNAGLKATINTDDPSIFHISLSEEYLLAHEVLGIPLNVLRQCTMAAAEAAFVSPEEKIELIRRLEEGWSDLV